MKPLIGLDETSGCNLEAVAELGFQFRFKTLEVEIVKTPRDRTKKTVMSLEFQWYTHQVVIIIMGKIWDPPIKIVRDMNKFQ